MTFDFYFTGIPFNNELLRNSLLSYSNSCLLLSQLNQRKDIYKWIDYFKTLPINNHKLFIDSGAFSAWTIGKYIDIDEYIEFINDYKDYITIAASVDSIPGIPKSSRLASQEEVEKSAYITWKNFLYMRSKMIDANKLLYTYHVGEPIKFLENALSYKDDKGFINYIAIGGLVGKSKEIINSELTIISKILNSSNNPNLKIHLFGMTQLDILERYPITSADSTTFIMEACYGNIRVNGKIIHVSNRGEIVNNNNFVHLNPALKEEVIKFLSKLNITLEQVQESAEYRKVVNMYFFQTWADNYQLKKIKYKTQELW